MFFLVMFWVWYSDDILNWFKDTYFQFQVFEFQNEQAYESFLPTIMKVSWQTLNRTANFRSDYCFLLLIYAKCYFACLFCPRTLSNSLSSVISWEETDIYLEGNNFLPVRQMEVYQTS